MAYVKPIRPLIVVASSKAEEFKSMKPDQEKREEHKKLLERFRKNMVKND